ncbi:aspartyl protease family protein [Dickeya aquatica]|uniref:Peptidase A2 domain-containing protein n=1 Tax=Dickeya aquatica TaxID=1401087 RepID=A0A375A804_9GAMM|nr:aspartyl protease family protein [Dickeya aquatica]SLM62194.1 hypothetical protein DAQ1742_01183 [Dickeya aquatica]
MSIRPEKINKKSVLTLLLGLAVSGCASHTIYSTPQPPPFKKTPILEAYFDEMLIIPVVINHQSFNFLVDTGASFTTIDKRVAKKITRPLLITEIAEIYREGLTHINTVYDRIKPESDIAVKPLPFSIGSEEIRDNDLWLAIDLSRLSEAMGTNIDGIIGIDTFRKLNWMVDNKKQRLTISKDAPGANTYQKCTAYDNRYNNMPVLWFDVDDSELALYVDTGADSNNVDIEVIKMIEKIKGKDAVTRNTENSAAVDLGGIVTENSYILKGITFAGMPLGEINVSANQNKHFAIGMDFLSRFDRYAFIPSRMMFCYDTQSIERKEIKAQRHIAIRARDKQIEVFYNPDDVLKKTGLRNGDILLKVNDITYAPAQINQVREHLKQIPKGKLKLTIVRNHEQRDIYL